MKLLRRPISASDWISDRFYVISMEFLSLSRRRSSSGNVSSGEERGGTDVFQLIKQTYSANSIEIPYVGNECFKELSQILTKLPVCNSRIKTELTSRLLLLTF